ncbi:MAG: hypothetical protein ABWY33_10280 [Cellulomonas sp.]
MTYLEELADAIRAHLPGGTHVPAGAEPLFLAYAVLLRAKGEAVTASDVHDAWVAWMLPHDADHEALRPYAELPAEVRALDEPFLRAIVAAARSVREPS